MTRIALYTTVYPAAKRFFPDWVSSVRSQRKSGFDVWIGADSMEVDPQLVVGAEAVHVVAATAEDTPASLRCRAMIMMADLYDAIVLSDSDDILEPERIESALSGLEDADVHGCALGLIDEAGQDLGAYFGLVAGEDPDSVLPRNNFLGFSNTAWRSDALRRCLPVPNDSIVLDWLLATRAWGHAARITFDRTVRMRYRQYGENTARVIPPFTNEQIIRATELVAAHYRTSVVDALSYPEQRRHVLQEAAARVERFRAAIEGTPVVLDTYRDFLNQLPPHRLWWLSVAHPALEHIWNN